MSSGEGLPDGCSQRGGWCLENFPIMHIGEAHLGHPKLKAQGNFNSEGKKELCVLAACAHVTLCCRFVRSLPLPTDLPLGPKQSNWQFCDQFSSGIHLAHISYGYLAHSCSIWDLLTCYISVLPTERESCFSPLLTLITVRITLPNPAGVRATNAHSSRKCPAPPPTSP